MNRIAVNPTQYITCRLCLEELGVYQITPTVKQQILYCFEIEIEQFDGLPQLLCEKCEKVTYEFTLIKKKFIEKQAELKNKVNNLPSIQSPSQDTKEDSPKITNGSRKKVTKKKRRVASSSSSEDDDQNGIRKARLSTNSQDSISSFPKSYTKQYVCRICNARWSNVILVNTHLKKKHGDLYKKYGHIISRHCQVEILKTDLGLADRGFQDKVMFCKDKIMKSIRAGYYITYTTRDYKKEKREKTRPQMNRERRNKYMFSSDSSDEEEVNGNRKRRKPLRSESSNNTTDNEANDEQPVDNEEKATTDIPEPTECIMLGSSDDESVTSGDTLKTSLDIQNSTNTDTKPDHAVINEILTACQNKYTKKHYIDSVKSKNPADIATNLKRKVLSIGIKSINKKLGINCVPLARFLENKNLDMLVTFKESALNNGESNNIRIMARKKNRCVRPENDSGWVDLEPVTAVVNVAKVSLLDRGNSAAPAQDSNHEMAHLNGTPIPTILQDLPDPKLLNANPVANPKQLPRKNNEVKSVVPTIDAAPPVGADDMSGMPVIMSTTSLAVPDSTKTVEKKVDAPRIKVKPASELMSAEPFKLLKQPPMLQQPQMLQLVVAPPMTPVSVQNGLFNVIAPRVTSGPSPGAGLPPAPTGTTDESLVLNTVELPNKRTNSPLLYFRTLLQMHNLTLLDTHAPLNAEFTCLIKFKVVYKQDKNEPVELNIGLYCARNIFCFKIKDRNLVDIDMTKITANWQWEVLKIFKGDVAGKVLVSAQKVSADQHEYTNKFLCLLKHIDIVNK